MQNSVSSQPTTAGVTSDAPYVPACGDEVEFEYKDKTWTGICLEICDLTALSVDLNVSCGDQAWAYPREVSKARFVKSASDTPIKFDSWNDAHSAAKAYFSAPTFKVGELIEYVQRDYDTDVWTTAVVTELYVGASDRPCRVQPANGSTCCPLSKNIRHLAGPYAEQQAQWIKHHGLEVGSEVKVVKKFEKYDDGCRCGGWNATPSKSRTQGKVFKIRGFQDGCIEVSHNGDWHGFPYFALEPVA